MVLGFAITKLSPSVVAVMDFYPKNNFLVSFY